jgi:UDP-3-O-[3-hydroxymyristoyl] glucosamine N-acyltransferase
VNDVALGEIAAALGGELIGDPRLRITGIATLDKATANTLSFLSNPRYRSQLETSEAACVIVSPEVREAALARGATIVTPDPYLYFARLTQWWAQHTRPARVRGVHPQAFVADGAVVDESASVGPFAVIEAGANVGAGAVIGAHAFVGAGVRIGAHTRLAPRVTVGYGCSIGERCIVHSGVVIGADGFGFAPHEGQWVKIEQLGAVRIGNDVEIGANTCIDRGALDDTVIEDGVKLDNLIQIAHNVRIGKHTAMAGCVGVAGSAVIGAHCTIGGGSGIVGHVVLADHVHVSAGTDVTRSITKPGLYTGMFPFDEHAAWEKNAATLRQLHSLRERLRALEKKTR